MLVNFPIDSLGSSAIALQVLIHLIYRNMCPPALADNFPYLLTGDVLFPRQLSSLNNPTLIENRLQVLNDLLLPCKSRLSLADYQSIVYVYCFFFGNPTISFRMLRRLAMSLTELVKKLRALMVTQQEVVVELLYRIALTFVRKVEDIHYFSQEDARIRQVKQACADADISNARFIAFMKNQPYKPPTASFDEYGVRVTHSSTGSSIGDMEVKESRYNMISLLQAITTGMAEIVKCFKKPLSTDPVLLSSQMKGGVQGVQQGVSQGMQQNMQGMQQNMQQGMQNMQQNMQNMQSMQQSMQQGNMNAISSAMNPMHTPLNTIQNPLNTMQNPLTPLQSAQMNALPPSQLGGFPSTPLGAMRPSPMTPLLSENPLPPPLPEALPANDPIPFPSRFVHLVYRYILGVFNCGELYQVDKTRSHEQLESRISFFAEVIRELPDRVARSILSMTLDQLYALTMKYPIYFVFFKTLINTRTAFRYTSSVLIDFIATHLDDLDCAQDSPPLLLTLFRMFCAQMNIMADDEAIFKPYLKYLLSDCIQHLMNTTNWCFYLDVLYGCLNLFQHNTLPDLMNELNSVIRHLVYQLAHIVQVTSDPHVKERVFEIAFRIFPHPQIAVLMNAILSFCVKALSGPDSLQRSGTCVFSF